MCKTWLKRLTWSLCWNCTSLGLRSCMALNMSLLMSITWYILRMMFGSMKTWMNSVPSLLKTNCKKIKNLLRKSGKPLQQKGRRLQEIDRAKSNQKRISGNSSSSTGLYELEGIHYSGPVLLPKFAGAEQYKSLRFKYGVLSTSLSESWIFLENKDVFMIKNFVKHHEQVYLVGRRFFNKEDMHIYPVRSSMLDELLVSKLSPHLESVPLTSVICKALRLFK